MPSTAAARTAGACSPTPPVNASRSRPPSAAAIAAIAPRSRWPTTPRASVAADVAGPRPGRHLAHVGRPRQGRPARAVLEGVGHLRRGQAGVGLQPQHRPGVDRARPGGHDQALQRGEAHRGVDRAVAPPPRRARRPRPGGRTRCGAGRPGRRRASRPARRCAGRRRRATARGSRSGARRGRRASWRGRRRWSPPAASGRGRRCRSRPRRRRRARATPAGRSPAGRRAGGAAPGRRSSSSRRRTSASTTTGAAEVGPAVHDPVADRVEAAQLADGVAYLAGAEAGRRARGRRGPPPRRRRRPPAA